MPYKPLNFDIFKLDCFDAEQESIKFEEAFKPDGKAFRPLPKESGSIVLIDELHQNNRYTFGTLAHRHMNYLPASVDDVGKIEDLRLNANQGLAYWNSFLFDSEMQMLVFESNKSGTSLKVFCDFFSYNSKIAIVNTEYVLDPSERERYNSMTVFKRLEIKVARIENGTIFDAQRKSVKQVLDAADGTGADTLECVLAADRYSKLLPQRVRDMIKGFTGYKDSEEVQVLTLTGKEDEDDRKSDVIDFIGGRIRLTFNIERKRFASQYGLKDKYERMMAEYGKYRPKLLKAYKLKKI